MKVVFRNCILQTKVGDCLTQTISDQAMGL
jgi:hypothetical protein